MSDGNGQRWAVTTYIHSHSEHNQIKSCLGGFISNVGEIKNIVHWHHDNTLSCCQAWRCAGSVPYFGGSEAATHIFLLPEQTDETDSGWVQIR